jgi:soluble lytic murein transglycosylase-like protein
MDVLSAIAIGALLNGIPERNLSAVCYVESKHNAGAYVHNDGGSPSIGLCQIKYSTAKFLGFKGPSKLLFDPYVNAFYAGKYLAYQVHRYKGDWKKAISAFNAGTATKKNHRYVRKVTQIAYGY